ncbi:MAG: LLM class flavin-dependent oxidoreductase [Thaumarchaeota archaeon]|nr:LLM class flavin-dependent oxidoreductase [Nitrososphaerota archaeon]
MIKVGIVLPQDGAKYESILNLSRKCEELGFESIWLYDHLARSKAPFLECWTTLTAIARNTKKIRLGSLVLNNTLRHPQLVAKMTSSLDAISGGRVELGLGAGASNPMEYQMFGLQLEEPATKIRRLAEAVQVIRRLWTEDKITFRGKYYSLNGATCNPKPVQKPSPPIWLSAKGAYMLKTVARHADGWNYCNSTEGFRDRNRRLDGYCRDIGRDPRSIQRSWHGGFLVGEDRHKIIKMLEKQPDLLQPEEYLKRNHLIAVESPEEAAAILRRLVHEGASYFMLTLPYTWREKDALRCLKLYAKKVLHSLK